MQLVLPSRNRTLGTIDALGIVGLVGLLVARYVPVARIIPFWGCTFRETTGVPCPAGLSCAAGREADFMNRILSVAPQQGRRPDPLSVSGRQTGSGPQR